MDLQNNKTKRTRAHFRPIFHYLTTISTLQGSMVQIWSSVEDDKSSFGRELRQSADTSYSLSESSLSCRKAVLERRHIPTHKKLPHAQQLLQPRRIPPEHRICAPLLERNLHHARLGEPLCRSLVPGRCALFHERCSVASVASFSARLVSLGAVCTALAVFSFLFFSPASYAAIMVSAVRRAPAQIISKPRRIVGRTIRSSSRGVSTETHRCVDA